MKFKGYISLGGLDDEQTDEFEIPDEDLEGLSDTEREKLIIDYLQDVLYQYIDVWYDIIQTNLAPRGRHDGEGDNE